MMKTASPPSAVVEEQLRDGFAELQRLGEALVSAGSAKEFDLEVLEFNRERALAKCICMAQDFQFLLGCGVSVSYTHLTLPTIYSV